MTSCSNQQFVARCLGPNWKTGQSSHRSLASDFYVWSGLKFFVSVSPGNIDKVDLSKLNEIDESLKSAKGKMADSELDKKLAELNDMARSQEDMISNYDQQIREIRADIDNLKDIKNTLPDGCFNTPSLERP